MRKIALVVRNLAAIGGTTTTVLQHGARFLEEGWDVHLFAERMDVPASQLSRLKIHRIPRLICGRTLEAMFFSKAFDWLSAPHSFEVVHGHGDILNQDVLSLHNCIHAAHEYVYGTPAPDAGTAKMHRLQKEEQRFKVLIANSHLMKDILVRQWSVDSEKIRVIYPGYDSTLFQAPAAESLRAKARELWDILPGCIVVGMITSGDLEKRGVGVLLKTLAQLKPGARKRIKVVIVGKPSQMTSYLEAARSMGIADQIIVKPPTSDVQSYFHGLDLFFYPALFEEFGQSVQEAMACGLPVLTSRRVGASELIRGAGERFVLSHSDAAAFAPALEELIQSAGLRKMLGQESAQNCAANNWATNFSQTLAVYKSILPALRTLPKVAPAVAERAA